MSLLGNVVGLVSGFKSDKKKNKIAKQDKKYLRGLADQQVNISKYIQEMANKIAGISSNLSDAYGNKAYYDPATGEWKTTLGGPQKAIQDASLAEELARYTQDNRIRREGLNDFENIRNRAAAEGDTALSNVLAFRRGVGRADAGAIGSQLRADRTREINAGYDDAERAAQTLQLRTGSSAVGDALSALARDRARAQASIGSPELEGMQMAEELNRGREANLLDQYKLFSGMGGSFYDNAFNPASYASDAEDRRDKAMNFDLSKYDLAMGGLGSAAGTISNAMSGMTGANQQYMNNRVWNPFGNLATGIDASIEKAVKQIMAGGAGG